MSDLISRSELIKHFEEHMRTMIMCQYMTVTIDLSGG